MKKLVLLLALAIGSFVSNAQEEVEKFEVTPEGVNGYVVEEFEGLSAPELYKKVNEWAQYNLGSADKAKRSQIENEYLKYKVYQPQVFTVKQGLTNMTYDLDETVEFRFKDGKVRVDITIDDITYDGQSGVIRMHLKGGFTTWSFYKNNGKPKNQTAEALQELNTHLNSIVSRVTDFINGKRKSW